MKLEAPPREMTDVWRSDLGMFLPAPEPVSRWIQRLFTDAYGTVQRRTDLIDLTLVVGTEVYHELLQELPYTYVTAAPLYRIYGAELKVDHELAVSFELRWTSLEERARAMAEQYWRGEGVVSFEAAYGGTCAGSGDRINVGDIIESTDDGYAHPDCVDATEKPTKPPCPKCWLVHAGECM